MTGSALERLRNALRIHRNLSAAELCELTFIPREQLPVYVARLREAGCDVANLTDPPAPARYRLDFDPLFTERHICVFPGCGTVCRTGTVGHLCAAHQRVMDERHFGIELIEERRSCCASEA